MSSRTPLWAAIATVLAVSSRVRDGVTGDVRRRVKLFDDAWRKNGERIVAARYR